MATTRRRKTPETDKPADNADSNGESSRPQHERKRVTEGQVADIQRLVPTPIDAEDRKALNLWQKRALMIEELGTVPKRGWNDHHKYNYALEADVVAYLGPLMSKYMLVTKVDVLLDRVERIDMGSTRSGTSMTLTRLPLEVTFINADNPDEREMVTWIGEGSDTGDKGVYKSYTGALKYLYLKWFLIATGDDPEAFTRTDALNEGRTQVENLSEGAGDTGQTQVRQVRGRQQPERGGRQNETTMAQIVSLGNLSAGLGLGPRGTAEEIDRVLGTQLGEALDALEGDDAKKAALVAWLKDRPGTDTGKVIYAVTQLAEKAVQIRGEQETAAAQTDYAGGPELSEDELLAEAREALRSEDESPEAKAADASGATRNDLDNES